MNTQDDKLTIQQVAEATGLSVYTLRYYERIGLIHQINRAENTHRRYTADDIGWIDFLNKLRATGMSIQQMRDYAELQRQGDSSLPQRLQMLKDHQCKVEARMAELQEHLKFIHYKVGIYEAIVNEQIPETA
jgi:DNA-binding transcriptional MerR regulator